MLTRSERYRQRIQQLSWRPSASQRKNEGEGGEERNKDRKRSRELKRDRERGQQIAALLKNWWRDAYFEAIVPVVPRRTMAVGIMLYGWVVPKIVNSRSQKSGEMKKSTK